VGWASELARSLGCGGGDGCVSQARIVSPSISAAADDVQGQPLTDPLHAKGSRLPPSLEMSCLRVSQLP